MGVNKDNVLNVYLVLHHYEEFAEKVQKNANLHLVREWEEDELANRKNLLDQIECIHKKTVQTPDAQEIMFERLFINIALEQVFKPDYTQFINDLVECYKQFMNNNKRSDERPIAVLLDILLILLRTSSKALRNSSTQVWYCGF